MEISVIIVAALQQQCLAADWPGALDKETAIPLIHWPHRGVATGARGSRT